MNKRHYEHTLPNIRGSLSNTYHIQAAAFPRLHFLFFHKSYMISCFFSFLSGVMEATCFACR